MSRKIAFPMIEPAPIPDRGPHSNRVRAMSPHHLCETLRRFEPHVLQRQPAFARRPLLFRPITLRAGVDLSRIEHRSIETARGMLARPAITLSSRSSPPARPFFQCSAPHDRLALPAARGTSARIDPHALWRRVFRSDLARGGQAHTVGDTALCHQLAQRDLGRGPPALRDRHRTAAVCAYSELMEAGLLPTSAVHTLSARRRRTGAIGLSTKPGNIAKEPRHRRSRPHRRDRPSVVARSQRPGPPSIVSSTSRQRHGLRRAVRRRIQAALAG